MVNRVYSELSERRLHYLKYSVDIPYPGFGEEMELGVGCEGYMSTFLYNNIMAFLLTCTKSLKKNHMSTLMPVNLEK